jgi:hypothetical protein
MVFYLPVASKQLILLGVGFQVWIYILQQHLPCSNPIKEERKIERKTLEETIDFVQKAGTNTKPTDEQKLGFSDTFVFSFDNFHDFFFVV